MCPHCGAVMPQPKLISSPIRQRIFDVVRSRPGVTGPEIMDAVYADREDGGPLAPNTIAVHVHKLNSELEAAESPLRVRGRVGCHGGYSVVNLEERKE